MKRLVRATLFIVTGLLPSKLASAQASDERASATSVLAQTLGPLLASWIAYERDPAKQQGIAPIPAPSQGVIGCQVVRGTKAPLCGDKEGARLCHAAEDSS